MNFSWLKNLFNNNKSKINTSDLATIDTSFIHVPKLSELSDENKMLVDKYLQELKYDDYETVLKYSDELLNKSNSEILFFMINLDEILKDISSAKNEVNEENYFKLLLSKEEIKQSIDEFYKIIDEAKLRLIALDAYIKKEEMRKYDFLGIFGKAERLKYLNDKSKLLNERDRLKTTIKISSQHLLAAFNALKEEQLLLNQMMTYIDSFKTFKSNYCDARICMLYIDYLLRRKELYDKKNCSKLEKLRIKCSRIEEDGSSISDISYLQISKIIPFLVKEERGIKKYSYEHRNDYRKIIDEIKQLVKKYEKTPSSMWNTKELEMIIRQYVITASFIVFICDKYLSDDILKELREGLFNLNYFVYISEVKEDNKNINMSSQEKSIKYGKSDIIDNYSKLMINSDRWNWTYDDEIEYYDKLSCEMLKTVGILNLPRNDYKRLERIIPIVVQQLRENEELHYLYDIYNGDFKHFNLKSYLQKFYQGYSNNSSFYHLSYEDDNVSLDDIYYLIIFLRNTKDILYRFNIDELFNDEYGFSEGMNKELFKIMVYSHFKNLDIQYDNRIFIIPRQIQFNQLLDYKKILKSIDELNIKDNHIAIYLANWGQVTAIHRVLKESHTHIKYLMMTDDLYRSYKDVYAHDLEQKVIRVPNHTRYNALSSYLDQELAIEQKQKY